MDIGGVNVRQQTALFGHFLVKRRARNRRVQHELVEVGLVADRRFDFLGDVVGRMVLESDDGRALHSNAVFAKLARELPDVRRPAACHSWTRGDSKPIHTQETPSSTSSSMVYFRIALAEAKTESSQLLPASFMRSSKRMARVRCSRKFSSITKNECTLSSDSIPHITSNSSSPVS